MIDSITAIMKALHEFSFFTILLRLGLAMVLGALIGTDRSRKGSPAGLKTHSVVAVGSALVILTSQYISELTGSTDLSRMPAQVISGIGFLGAGTILVMGGNRIKGLTSAATIWFSACMGIAVGIGFYEGAIGSVIFEIIIFKVLSRMSVLQNGVSTIEIYISYTSCFNLQQFVSSLEAAHARIIEIESNKLPTLRDGEERIYNTQFIIQLDKEIDQDELVSSLKNTLGVLTVLQF
ncbi:MgtC/SapB family protein [Erysipelothrix anatis]|uniref:MgtC/SapB family protein n=1 Tax=Erysipelothrix anatis TaxID=2683713 RepID=UPI001359EF49|nr:MgtC/SapB family protein [Erysipelothrix anatis]